MIILAIILGVVILALIFSGTYISERGDGGIVVNPSVVLGDIDNGKFIKSHGNLELTAGVVYRFKT